MNKIVQLILFGGVVLAAGWAEAARPQYLCYRSFKRELDTTRRFAEQGIVVRGINVGNTLNSGGAPYCDYPPVWTGFGQYRWECADAQFDDILEVSPEARFIVLVDLNTPAWLARKLRFDSFDQLSIAAASPYWREDTLAWMTNFLDHVEGKYSDKVLAYVLTAGSTTEWEEYWHGATSADFDARWQEWCAARGRDYGLGVPSYHALTNAAFEGAVYDPRTERVKIDYWRFRNGFVADTLLWFAHEARRHIPATTEIGAFFGYYLLCNGGMYNSWDHMGYEKVFASPDIDFALSPATYAGRACGGPVGSMAIDGTLRRHGKRLFHEIDFWPHAVTSKLFAWCGRYFVSLEDDLAGNTREAAFAMVRGCSSWWFDMWGGFYEQPALFDRIARLRKIQERLPDGLRVKSCADVLFVADPDSAFFTNEKAQVYRGGPSVVRDVLAKTGLAVDYYSFSDLAHIDLKPYRAVVFPMQPQITPEQAAFLRERICTDGRAVVFHHAAGISDGADLDIARVKEWAGVAYGTKGVSVTDRSNWTSVYVPDYATFTPVLLRQTLVGLGAHAWTDGPAVVHANERVLSVHYGKDEGGLHRIALPHRYSRVVDLLTGETVARDAVEFTFEFGSPDTRLFELISGKCKSTCIVKEKVHNEGVKEEI